MKQLSYKKREKNYNWAQLTSSHQLLELLSAVVCPYSKRTQLLQLYGTDVSLMESKFTLCHLVLKIPLLKGYYQWYTIGPCYNSGKSTGPCPRQIIFMYMPMDTVHKHEHQFTMWIF